eukprot:CAMPEP_0174745308 /NCGR_PEP_ID=MMETSP1094-20130205/86497_1 /TAXON_ID=156173 /ORGANISM="Chrysochromulina brevifilum, Strain UTEX LB 985" /LENGTH=75 /DNA_ID=CAMNT_0015949839 /DNA_START=296 /DNA_END=520 /DNA_ORIENTATION=+
MSGFLAPASVACKSNPAIKSYICRGTLGEGAGAAAYESFHASRGGAAAEGAKVEGWGEGEGPGGTADVRLGLCAL